MATFSRTSLDKLETCHPILQDLAHRAIELFDFGISEGHRSVEKQQALYAIGRTEPGDIVTKVDGVNVVGRHNREPSEAFDFVPWVPGIGYDWNDKERFCVAGGIFLGIASEVDYEYPIRWGGNWDRDDQFNESGDDWDLPHIEVLVPH